jgi:hypothetical protein
VQQLSNHSSDLGISGLPVDVRADVLNVAYYYQTVAALIGIGIVDERRTLALLRIRFVKVWDAVEPFVRQERRANPHTGDQLLTILEFYAERARLLPDDAVQGLLGRTVARY